MEDAMTREEAFDQLVGCKITKLTSVTSLGGDYVTGPRLQVRVEITTKDGLSGTLLMVMLLNEQAHVPRHIELDLGDAEHVEVWSPMPEDDDPYEKLMGVLCFRLIRRVAMYHVPGYTEMTEQLHRSFVALADV